MAEMSKKSRKRLAQLFAMLGSDNVNERENARQMLDNILRKNRKTWNDLTELLQTGASGSAWDIDDDERAKTPDAPSRDISALELVHFILQEYVDLKPHEYIAVSLWILHTHMFREFMISPRLALTSPVRGCGKTTLLALLELLVARAQRTDNISPAAIFRLIDQGHPTLLIDEADNLGLQINGPLRSVLNLGHRKGGTVTRVIRDSPKRFSTFAPMAFAAIGSLPLPLMHRSIVIHMERSDNARPLKRLEDSDTNDPNSNLNTIYRYVWQWARGNPALNPDPEMPKELRNRQADNWRPLISIADSFGPSWAGAAREAAVSIKRGYHDEDVGVVLLSDIRQIFNGLRADRLASETLTKTLVNMDDGLWSDWRGMHDDQQPHRLSQAELARLLAPFRIRSKSIWPVRRKEDSKSRKGYYRSQFEAVWRRYCAEDGTAAQPSNLRYLRQR
jgi:hypothetical protein